jgi:hypothetical protein
MTKFNPENKSILTIGESLKPAMLITDKDDAKQYFDDYVKYTMSHMNDEKIKLLEMKGNINVDDMLKSMAEEICKKNLGYFCGYYDNETMVRVYKLFECNHPIFGNNIPSAKEAFERGLQLGKIS